MKIIEKVDNKYILNPKLDSETIYHLRYKGELIATAMIKSYADEYVLLDFLIRHGTISYRIESFYSVNYPNDAQDVDLIPLVEDENEK